jgi:dihydrolipoamide dehydrogenase
MESYDLAIIGGGPAGYLAAERASAGGLGVAVFEKGRLGGVCLNEGCIPTKSLLYSAKLLDGAAHAEACGLRIASASMDHSAVIARKNKVVDILVSGVEAKMKFNKVAVIPSAAALDGRTETGFRLRAGGETCEAARVLIATGSAPVIPPIPGLREGLDSGFVITSREALNLEKPPGRLVIVGGGVIGLEMACYYSIAGAKVSVVEMLDKIAGPFDAEISKILLNDLRKRGITFRLGSTVTGISKEGVSVSAGEASEVIPADAVLLCIGRRPSCEGLGLESLGVYTENGAVVTDGSMRTNIPNLYAAGDVNGKFMLAHTAYREAETAVNHMLGKADKISYAAIPSVIYTSPEAAGVGETEESAREKGINVKIARLSMRYSGRYVAENASGDGICKLLADEKSQRLIGAHLLGSYASEIILAAAMMVESRLPLARLKEFVFPHPTVGEIIRETLFEL